MPPRGPDGERAALEAWLRFQRDTLAWKYAGLTPSAARPAPRILSGRPGEWLYWATDDGDFTIDGAVGD